MIAAALIGAGVVVGVHRVLEALEPEAPSGVETRTSANVVAAVRDLARLESAEFHMQRVIDLRDRQSHLFGLVQAQDAVLLVAAADVVAGIDLAEMGDGDIQVDETNRTVTLILPPPRVLVTRLDHEHTFVHTRSTDLLAQRDETLESRARRRAEEDLEQAAIEAGILRRARRNAGETVRSLVRALGFERVDVQWADRG
ncbi:MAG: DUF4230 domain-containing protein [Myxococcota bacterium]